MHLALILSDILISQRYRKAQYYDRRPRALRLRGGIKGNCDRFKDDFDAHSSRLDGTVQTGLTLVLHDEKGSASCGSVIVHVVFQTHRNRFPGVEYEASGSAFTLRGLVRYRWSSVEWSGCDRSCVSARRRTAGRPAIK